MVVVTDTGKLDELRQMLTGRREGEIYVEEVRTDYRYELDGDEYLQVTLVVTDPRPDQATWPLDDVYAVRLFARRTAEDLGIMSDLDIEVKVSGGSETWDEDDEDDLDQVWPDEAGGR